MRRWISPLIVSVLLGVLSAAWLYGAGYYEPTAIPANPVFSSVTTSTLTVNTSASIPGIALPVYKNLKVTTTGAANNQSVLITADKVLLLDNTDRVFQVSSVSLADNLAASGANGLDNGAIAANVGYFLYVISNGTTTAALASTSASSPVMPGGYVYKALVGWCTTDATTTPFNVEEFTQTDDRYVWDLPASFSLGNPTALAANLAAGGLKAWATVPPNITKSVELMINNNSGSTEFCVNPATFTVSPGNTFAYVPNANALAVSLPIFSSQTFYYGGPAVGGAAVYLSGFTLKR